MIHLRAKDGLPSADGTDGGRSVAVTIEPEPARALESLRRDLPGWFDELLLFNVRRNEGPGRSARRLSDFACGLWWGFWVGGAAFLLAARSPAVVETARRVADLVLR